MSGVRLSKAQVTLLRLMEQHDFSQPFVLKPKQYPSAYVMSDKGLVVRPNCVPGGKVWKFIVADITPAGREWLAANKEKKDGI